MKQMLLMGLGNPGGQFSHTRHNIGADMVVSWLSFIVEHGATVSDTQSHEKFHARVREVKIDDSIVTVLDQIVFMNESGKALSAYLRYHPIHRENILVVHDDIELLLGEIKFQKDGSAHGHNGIRSIHEYLGDMNVQRLRIGIGRPTDAGSVEKFVLSTFTPEEKAVLQAKENEIMEAVTNTVIPDLIGDPRRGLPSQAG